MRQTGPGPGSGDLLEGSYTNYFEVGHNAFEFLIDFGQLYCEGSEGRMHTRIVTSPVFAKRLAEVLNRALAAYEQSHGQLTTEAGSDDAGKATIRHIHALKHP